jgi:hypothetical protein
MHFLPLFSLTVLLLLTHPGRIDPDTDDIPDSIRLSLQAGQANQLAAHFEKTIQLVIDSEGIEFPGIRADHAELILNTFFRKHPPSSFRYLDRGTAERMYYLTGSYQSGGQTFSVYMLLRRNETNQYVISTLQFRQTA